MARNRSLKPIDQTRSYHGRFTSETGARLLRRRGGLARAKQQALDGYKMLAEMRVNSIIARRLKAAMRRQCLDCASFAESILAMLAQQQQPAKPISPEDRKLIS
jgi:hypothetical protein